MSHATPAATRSVYRRILDRLEGGGVPFLVGGSFALSRYTGIDRHSKDFDLFLRARHAQRVEETLAADPDCVVEHFSPHWLWKVFCDGEVIDLIYSSGNGIAEVDDEWFKHAEEHEIFGSRVRLCPPEEMIWSKAFIMERERFDGADVAHILRERGESLDWARLLRRFGHHWRVLAAHLVLFDYIYPDHRLAIPQSVLDEIHRRLDEEPEAVPSRSARVCRGTLLSRTQYLVDIDEWGYHDARLFPEGKLDGDEIERWTEKIREDGIPTPRAGDRSET